MSASQPFTVIDAKTGLVLRTGDSAPGQLGRELKAGEQLVAGAKLPLGQRVEIRVRGTREILADLEARVAALEKQVAKGR